MLVAAGLNAWAFHRTVYREVHEWDTASTTAAPGAHRGHRLARPLGRHHRRRTNDRLQLVRLRPAAESVHHLGGRLLREGIRRDSWQLSTCSRHSKRRASRSTIRESHVGLRRHRVGPPAGACPSWAARSCSSTCAFSVSGSRTAGPRARRVSAALDDRCADRAHRHGLRTVRVRNGEVLLQHAVLGEDEHARPRDDLHVHDATDGIVRSTGIRDRRAPVSSPWSRWRCGSRSARAAAGLGSRARDRSDLRCPPQSPARRP